MKIDFVACLASQAALDFLLYKIFGSLPSNRREDTGNDISKPLTSRALSHYLQTFSSFLDSSTLPMLKFRAQDIAKSSSQQFFQLSSFEWLQHLLLRLSSTAIRAFFGFSCPPELPAIYVTPTELIGSLSPYYASQLGYCSGIVLDTFVIQVRE